MENVEWLGTNIFVFFQPRPRLRLQQLCTIVRESNTKCLSFYLNVYDILKAQLQEYVTACDSTNLIIYYLAYN